MARKAFKPTMGAEPEIRGVKEGYPGLNKNNTVIEVDVFSTNWQSGLDCRNPKDPGPDPLGLMGATEPAKMGQPENPLQINGPEFSSSRTFKPCYDDTGYGFGPEKPSRVGKGGKDY